MGVCVFYVALWSISGNLGGFSFFFFFKHYWKYPLLKIVKLEI